VVVFAVMIVAKCYTYKRKLLYIAVTLLGAFSMVGKLYLDNNDSEHNAFSDIVMKLDETSEGFKMTNPYDYENLNLSSYATLANLWVAENAPSRIVGTGLGTHEQSYYRLYKSDFDLYGLNSKDAYSVGTRVFSEFGVVGILIFVIFILKNINRLSVINIASFLTIFSFVIRGGHYTAFGFVFWLMLFYYTNRNNTKKRFHNMVSNTQG
jgi:hypothetical protein